MGWSEWKELGGSEISLIGHAVNTTTTPISTDKDCIVVVVGIGSSESNAIKHSIIEVDKGTLTHIKSYSGSSLGVYIIKRVYTLKTNGETVNITCTYMDHCTHIMLIG